MQLGKFNNMWEWTMLNNTGERGPDKILGGFYEGKLVPTYSVAMQHIGSYQGPWNCIIIMTSYFIHLWNKKKD